MSRPRADGAARAARLAFVTLAAAAGGSAAGAALLLVPALLFGGGSGIGFTAGLVALVSLPFTLAGTLLLTGLSLLWSGSLSGRCTDYGGIVLAALGVGAVMPLPFLGLGGLLFGALFGAITALLWAALYTRLALPPGMREFGHG